MFGLPELMRREESKRLGECAGDGLELEVGVGAEAGGGEGVEGLGEECFPGLRRYRDLFACGLGCL